MRAHTTHLLTVLAIPCALLFGVGIGLSVPRQAARAVMVASPSNGNVTQNESMTFRDGCNTCTYLGNGVVSCTLMACAATPTLTYGGTTP